MHPLDVRLGDGSEAEHCWQSWSSSTESLLPKAVVVVPAQRRRRFLNPVFWTCRRHLVKFAGRLLSATPSDVSSSSMDLTLAVAGGPAVLTCRAKSTGMSWPPFSFSSLDCRRASASFARATRTRWCMPGALPLRCVGGRGVTSEEALRPSRLLPVPTS